MKKIPSPKIRPQIESEDETFWEETTREVKRIKTVERDLSKPEYELRKIQPTVNVFAVYQGEDLSSLKAGETANIDSNTIKRFKRGEIRIEARLDLHGQVVNDAYDMVEKFIHNSYQFGRRCVQIITGKGRHREDELFAPKGVLKDLVPQWLNNDNIRPLVLTFDYSLPKDGGDGALTVLLRRRRE